MSRRRFDLFLLRGTAAAVGLLAVSSAAWGQAPVEAPAQIRLDIPAQPLASALTEFARQSRQQLLYSPDLVAGKRSAALAGEFSAREGLRRLLAGSGLGFRTTASGTFVLSDAAAPGAEVDATGETDAGSAAAEDESAEIVVTGTTIRGTGGSVGTPVTTIRREDIRESGYATTQDILKTSPLVFQGGASEDTRVGGSAASNTFFGSGVDVRGLGTESTLVLLNGRRLPLAGGASFVDVSNIPATLIERIEILPDGASAIYGADAVGGVVNIILRRDFDGAESLVRVGTSTQGGGSDLQASQTFGTRWSTGNVMLSGEYYQRDSLANADRDFTRSADLTPFGGTDFRDTFSNPGNILSLFTGQPAFAIPPGQDGTNLTTADLLPGVVNLRNQNATTDLMPRQERWSLFGSLRQELGPDTSLFAEARYGRREFRSQGPGFATTIIVPASNPFFVDPFGFGITAINYDFGEDFGPTVFTGAVRSYGGAAGIEQSLWGDWQVRAYGSYSREESSFDTLNNVDQTLLAAALADPDPATAFNPFGDGSNTNPATIERLRRTTSADLDSRVWSVNATADGSVMALPGGDLRVALGIDYREETFIRSFPPIEGIERIEANRNVLAFFGEIYAPFVGPANARPGLERLVPSAALRNDEYGGIGADASTLNPKVGLLWSPVRGMSFRGSYGTSFKAPKLVDLDESFNTAIAFPLPDPFSPTGTTLSLLRGGNNADLRNETSTNLTFGVDLEPPAVPGLRVGINYFNIDYRNRIADAGLTTAILAQPVRYASIITRNPTPEQIAEVCNSPDYRFADPATCVLLPIEAIVDARLNNTAITHVQGVDLSAAYALDAGRTGNFSFQANATYLLQFRETYSAGTPSLDISDTVGNPARMRLRGSVGWQHASGLSAIAFVNHTGAYRDQVSVPERRVDAWTTLDLTLSYDFGGDRGALSGLRLTASATNLFDTDPPFVNNPAGVGYDPANADPIGRFLSLTVSKRW